MAKSTKKGASKGKAKQPAAKRAKGRGELTEGAVDRVAGGGNVDYFLKLDGVDGESQQKPSPLHIKIPL